MENSENSNKTLQPEDLQPETIKVVDNEGAVTTNEPPLREEFPNTAEEIEKWVTELVEYLMAQTSYDNINCLNVMKTISSLYAKNYQWRKGLAEKLLQLKFIPLLKEMLVTLTTMGIFSSDSVWFTVYYILSTIWNLSDCSKLFAKELADRGFIELLNINLTHEPYLNNATSKNISYVLKSTLSILQNVVRLVPEAKPKYQAAKVPQSLKPFLTWPDEFHKAVAILTLSAIADEEQNRQFEDTGAIPFIVTCLEKSVSSQNRRYRGFSPLELLEGLGRLAVNDQNKIKIVEAGALPVLVKLLQDTTHPKEQKHAAQTLWTLGFDPEVKIKIATTENCIHSLEVLTKSDDSDIKRNAEGALWKLRGEDEHNRKEKQNSDESHIFISYNHTHQAILLQVKDFLQQNGFKVWMDVEEMGGSMLEAMAHAVENAWVVLVALSENYKLSNICRQEAEYTFQQNKPIIPLMVQRGYKADGWLGMLVGSRLYINFDGKLDFDVASKRLMQELKKATSNKDLDRVHVSDGVGHFAIGAHNAPVVKAAAPKRSIEPESKTWKQEQVANWAKEHGLFEIERFQPVLSALDGPLLSQMVKFRAQCPDIFYKQLTDKLEIDFLNLLKICNALDSMQ